MSWSLIKEKEHHLFGHHDKILIIVFFVEYDVFSVTNIGNTKQKMQVLPTKLNLWPSASLLVAHPITQTRIHMGFHRFTKISQIFKIKYDKKAFQDEIW